LIHERFGTSGRGEASVPSEWRNGQARATEGTRVEAAFDDLARELVSGAIPRGRALRLIGGALLSAALGGLLPNGAWAARAGGAHARAGGGRAHARVGCAEGRAGRGAHARGGCGRDEADPRREREDDPRRERRGRSRRERRGRSRRERRGRSRPDRRRRSRPERPTRGCRANETLVNGICCPGARVCQPSNTCCPPGQICAPGGGVCCPPERVCTVGGVPDACCAGTCVGGECV
jgi:hypothetical protein